MFLRHLSAFILGVLLQVSLLGAAPAISTFDTALSSQQCSCCEGRPSCPCAESSKGQKPAPPAILSNQEQQFLALAPTTPRIQGLDTRAGPRSVPDRISLNDNFAGYFGVTLQVAFCRYAI